MKPTIKTGIDNLLYIDNQPITQDIYINPEGEVIMRASVLPANSALNMLDLNEATDFYDPNINEMIIGCNVDDKVTLSDEAIDFLEAKRCKIKLLPLGEAIHYWNRYEGHAIGLFHLSN